MFEFLDKKLSNMQLVLDGGKYTIHCSLLIIPSITICLKKTLQSVSHNSYYVLRGGGAQGKSGGDESAYESAYSNASVLPPSKKPTNTGKEDTGQAIALPVYAQVDKSKKKPRSEREAQVRFT